MTRRGRPRHPDVLTPRQWEVLALLRERLSDQEIADRLGISLDGAKYHVSEILSKLGVSSREEAAAWEPEEPRPAWRRFVALPLAAKVWSVAVVAAAIAGLGLLAWGVAATDSGEQDEARAIADKALAAMAALDSYRTVWLELEAPWGIMDYVAPDRFAAPDPFATYNDRLRDHAREEHAWIITVGTTQYRRMCSSEGECNWFSTFVGDFVPGATRTEWVGPGPHFLPQWPLLAIDLAFDLRISGEEEVDGGRFIVVSGEVNPLTAQIQNQIQVLESTGIGHPLCKDMPDSPPWVMS